MVNFNTRLANFFQIKIIILNVLFIILKGILLSFKYLLKLWKTNLKSILLKGY